MLDTLAVEIVDGIMDGQYDLYPTLVLKTLFNKNEYFNWPSSLIIDVYDVYIDVFLFIFCSVFCDLGTGVICCFVRRADGTGGSRNLACVLVIFQYKYG